MGIGPRTVDSAVGTALETLQQRCDDLSIRLATTITTYDNSVLRPVSVTLFGDADVVQPDVKSDTHSSRFICSSRPAGSDNGVCDAVVPRNDSGSDGDKRVRRRISDLDGD